MPQELGEWAVRRRSAWEVPQVPQAPEVAEEWAGMQMAAKVARAQDHRANSMHRAVVRPRETLPGEVLRRSWVSG